MFTDTNMNYRSPECSFDQSLSESLLQRLKTTVNNTTTASRRTIMLHLMFLMHFLTFVFGIIMVGYVQPTYSDVKELLPEFKLMLHDINSITPDVKQSFIMLKHLCNSTELSHLCKNETNLEE